MHGAPFHSNLRANLQRHLTLLNLRSPKAHHLDQQHLPHTGKIITCLLTPPHRYRLPPSRGMLHGPGRSGHKVRGRVRRVGSTGCVSPRMPRIGAWDRRDPCPVIRTSQDGQRGMGVGVARQGEALGRVAPDVRMILLTAPGAWKGGAGSQQGSTIRVMASLRVVTPPFARGL